MPAFKRLLVKGSRHIDLEPMPTASNFNLAHICKDTVYLEDHILKAWVLELQMRRLKRGPVISMIIYELGIIYINGAKKEGSKG